MPAKRKPARRVRPRDANGLIDEVGRESFPASDPPAYAGGPHRVGAPQDHHTPKPEVRAAAAKKRK